MLQASDGPVAEDDGRSQVRKTWAHLQTKKDSLDLTVPRSVYLLPLIHLLVTFTYYLGPYYVPDKISTLGIQE